MWVLLDMIQVGNNTESQLDELLSRKERQMDLGFMFHNSLWPKPGWWILLSKQKDVENVKSVVGQYDYLFS